MTTSITARLRLSLAALALFGAALSGTARAEPEHLSCRAEDGTPAGSPGTLQLSCTDTTDNGALEQRTHVFVFPTGNTLRKGESTIRAHGLGVYNQVAMGLTDNIELNASVPFIPIFASVGVRAQLMPRESATKVTLSGGLWTLLMDGDDAPALGTLSVTFAHQTETTNVHATIGTMAVLDDHDDDALTLASVGIVTRAAGAKHAFFAELGRMGFAGEDEGLAGTAVGLKLMGRHFDADLGVLIPFIQETDGLPLLPMISLHYRF